MSRPPSRPVLVLAAVLSAVTALAWLAPAVAVPAPRVRPEVPVSTTDASLEELHNSPTLAAHPRQPLLLAMASRLDGPDFGCALHISGDGGRGWVAARPVPKLPAGAEKCYAPEVGFDRAGVLYYLFVGLHGGGNTPMGAFLVTSGDGGATFGPPRKVLGPRNFFVRMVIDPARGRSGRLFLVWLHTGTEPSLGALPPGDNPIMAAHSDDGGRSFSRPVRVSDRARHLAVAPSVAIGADHAVHVAYFDLREDLRDYQGLEGPTWGGDWSVVVATSADAGRHFSNGVAVDARVRPPGRSPLIFTMPPPALAADGSGHVYVAWADARRGDPDVVLRSSTDRGRSWGPLRRINDDPRGSGTVQYLPRLAVAPGGRVDAIFYDRRRDAANRANDVDYAFSPDHGATWSANQRLTTEASDSRNGQDYAGPAAKGLVEIGSRLGLLSQRRGVVAAWPDTRNAAGGIDQQDLFATAVDLPQATSRPPPWSVAAGIGVGVVLIGAAAARRRRVDRTASARIQPVRPGS